MVTLTDEEVRARLGDIDRKLEKLTLVESFLRKEREQYQTVLSVMERLGAGSPSDALAAELEAESAHIGPSPSSPEVAKPAGIPPMPQMIQEALLVAWEGGKDRLEPKDITQFVRDRYWPDAPTSSVGPTVWRMAKEKRLRKLGDFYALPDPPPNGAEFSARGVEAETAGEREVRPADLF